LQKILVFPESLIIGFIFSQAALASGFRIVRMPNIATYLFFYEPSSTEL